NLESDLAQLRTGEILYLAGWRYAPPQPLIDRAQVRNRFGDFADEREFFLLIVESFTESHGHRNQPQAVQDLEGLQVDVGDIQFAERGARVRQIVKVERRGAFAQVDGALAGEP